MDRADVLRTLHTGGLPDDWAAGVSVLGQDPIVPSKHSVGEVAAVALAVTGGLAGRIHALRSGVSQEVSVTVRAAAASLMGFMLQQFEGLDLRREMSPVTDLFEDRDGRWIHLHGGFPHLARGVVDLLDCAADHDVISAAVRKADAFELEEALAEDGLCGAVARTPQEWANHPQGIAQRETDLVSVRRLCDAPARGWRDDGRPLAGVRVLDMTRVLAGPTCGRTLASHGAGVLRVQAESLPYVEPFVVDTGHGKRNAWLDLDVEADVEILHRLLDETDVVVWSYRPGSAEARGLSPEILAERHPGIVHVNVSCYGTAGPWGRRRGWEQLAQSATGLAHIEGTGSAPRLVPAAVTDYTTGYLAAAGAMAALTHQRDEGGSWAVDVSLCRTAMWLTDLGPTHDPLDAEGLGDPADLMTRTDTDWGALTHLVPPVRMSETPPRWDLAPSRPGSAEAVWDVTP